MESNKTGECTINGKDVETMVDVRASLTDMLRNDYRLTSVKKGCEVGECGACNVLIDGEAFNSCIYLAIWADGKNIRTLEGLVGPNGELAISSRRLSTRPPCNAASARRASSSRPLKFWNPASCIRARSFASCFQGHLCRCTGYENILKAVRKDHEETSGKSRCLTKKVLKVE